ncbi:hypothetical protein GCM10011348_17250 [Marinobacterium nitratireducens]|uniref:Chaperone NapD n=1 Tax=Marinobacterium nitratireducens TaxID=518897 RepID=A0A917ZEN8_9GAMM|nr:chaperone NapD [Marinobacterium nitratireducens]GGO80484.1 hypothetical protein GCM10011348_17250 [Marinobacterium nitratireducens]
MDERLHIASLIVYLRTRHLAGFRRWVTGFGNLEIAMESPEGKLVLVAELPSHGAINALLEQLQERPGVLNAVLVYHEELDASRCEEPLPQPATATDVVRIAGES